jgi:hypothetical protein
MTTSVADAKLFVSDTLPEPLQLPAVVSVTVGVMVDEPAGVVPVVWIVRVNDAGEPVLHVVLNVAPVGRPATAVIRIALLEEYDTVTVYVASLPAVTGFGACAPMETEVMAANAESGASNDPTIRRACMKARNRRWGLRREIACVDWVTCFLRSGKAKWTDARGRWRSRWAEPHGASTPHRQWYAPIRAREPDRSTDIRRDRARLLSQGDLRAQPTRALRSWTG